MMSELIASMRRRSLWKITLDRILEINPNYNSITEESGYIFNVILHRVARHPSLFHFEEILKQMHSYERGAWKGGGAGILS